MRGMLSSASWQIGLFILCLAGAGVAHAQVSAGTAISPPVVSVVGVGSEEIIMRYRSEACDRHDVPDAPARAFRDSTGEISVIASHVRTRRLVGTDLKSLSRDCRIVLEGSDSSRVEDLDSLLWIVATWTDDGQVVHALVHNEYRGKRYGNCLTDTRIGCWYNTIVYARSYDGGNRFNLEMRGTRLIAGASVPYDPAYRVNVGFFNPSNIIKNDGYYYFFAFTTGDRLQRRGNCLFRTRDVGDPTSWVVWDGSNFVSRLNDPYYGQKKSEGVQCKPIQMEGVLGPVYSVAIDPDTGVFVAVTVANRGESGLRKGEEVVAAFSSRDLISWSSPAIITKTESEDDVACENRSKLYYPSLLSDDSPGRNFEYLHKGKSVVVATRARLDKNCRATLLRDLVAIPVQIRVR